MVFLLHISELLPNVFEGIFHFHYRMRNRHQHILRADGIHFSVHFLTKEIKFFAIDMGISFEELLKRAQESLEYDRRLDEHQAMLARKGNTVIGSRLAIWMVPEADLKVYLKASHAVRVQRIHAREGGDMASIERFTRERDAKDRDRYLTLYNIDIDDISCAHLVIDTERWSASKVAEIIADAYNIAK